MTLSSDIPVTAISLTVQPAPACHYSLLIEAMKFASLVSERRLRSTAILKNEPVNHPQGKKLDASFWHQLGNEPATTIVLPKSVGASICTLIPYTWG